MLHLTRRYLSFVARAAVELRTFNEGVRVAIANHRAANLAAEALGMESMVASNHNGSRDHLTALLTTFAELSPVVVLAKQQSILLEVEVAAVH